MADQSSSTSARQIATTDWNDPASVALCSRAMRHNRSYKMRAEKRAHRNRSFLFGDQWHVWKKDSQRMDRDDERQRWQAQLVYNIILMIAEQRMSQLIRTRRVWSAIPATTDEKDRMAARTKEQILDYQYNEVMQMPRKMREALMWMMSSSVVFGHPFWNSEKGPPLNISVDDFLAAAPQTAAMPENVPPEMMQQVAAQLNQQHVQQQLSNFANLFGQQALAQGGFYGKEGDMDFDIAPIFEVGWFPFNAKRWDDVLVFSRTVKMPCQKASDLFGLPVEEIRQWMTPNARGDAFGVSRWAEDYFSATQMDGFYDDCVYVDKLYCPPSKAFPGGREACVIGWSGTAHYVGDLQNYSGRVPLFPLVEKPVPGMIDGTCLVDQLIAPQENLNTALSQIADYRNKRVMPTLVRFIGDKGNKKQLSNRPGAIYECNSPDMMPVTIQSPDIGADYFNSVGQDIKFMHDLGGVASVDLGGTDNSNVRSGRAILSLQEQNATRLAPVAQRIDEWLEDIGNFVDLEIQNRVRLERVIQIVGEKNELEVRKYKGMDLWATNRGEPSENKQLVRVTATSNFPKSQQEIFNFLNMAMNTKPLPMLDPIKDRDMILQMIGFNDYRAMFDRTRADKASAVEVIEKWEHLQSAGAANEADDHQTFFEVLNEWQKTQRCQQAIQMAGAQMLQAGVSPMVAPNWLAKEIHERVRAHRVGVIKDELRKMYEARTADIQAWIDERGEWLASPMGAEIVAAFFPAPMNSAPMMPAVAAEKNPDKPKSEEKMEPSVQSEEREERSDKEDESGDEESRDKSKSQTQVQKEMSR